LLNAPPDQQPARRYETSEAGGTYGAVGILLLGLTAIGWIYIWLSSPAEAGFGGWYAIGFAKFVMLGVTAVAGIPGVILIVIGLRKRSSPGASG
jgi:hypothetical protein